MSEQVEIRDERGNFEGFEPRDCREHRTVGTHRAWCHDDGEWCYPSSPCRGCEEIPRKAREEALSRREEALLQWQTDMVAWIKATTLSMPAEDAKILGDLLRRAGVERE